MNKKVHLSSGFILSVISVLVAVFLGGLLKTYLSSDALLDNIKTHLPQKNSKFDFQIPDSKVTFSGTIFPELVLELNEVQLISKEECSLLRTVYIPKMKSSFSLWNILIKNNWRVKNISIEKAKIDMADCESKKTHSKPKENVFLTKKENLEEIQKHLKSLENSLLSKELSSFFIHIKELEISKITKSFLFKDSRFSISKNKKMKIESRWNISESEDTPPYIKIKALFDQKEVDFDFHLLYREGRAKTIGKINLDSGKTFFNIGINHFPVSKIFEWTQPWQSLLSAHQPKNWWLNCQIHFKNNILENKKNLSLNSENCLFTSSKGRFSITKKVEIFPFNKDFSPIHFKIENFKGRVFFQTLRDKAFQSHLKNLGIINGELVLFNLNHMKAKLKVSELDAIFSHNDQKAYQKVESFYVDMDFKKDTTLLKFYDVVLSNGKVKGEAYLKLNKELKDGNFKINASVIDFNSSVKKILSSQFKPFSIQGKGLIKNARISSFTGELFFPEILQNNWSVNNLKMDISFEKKYFKSQFNISSFKINSPHSYFKPFEETKYFSTKEKYILFTDVRGSLFIDEKIKSLKKLRFYQNRKTFFANLNWDKSKKFKGTLKHLNVSRDFSGEFFHLLEFK